MLFFSAFASLANAESNDWFEIPDWDVFYTSLGQTSLALEIQTKEHQSRILQSETCIGASYRPKYGRILVSCSRGADKGCLDVKASSFLGNDLSGQEPGTEFNDDASILCNIVERFELNQERNVIKLSHNLNVSSHAINPERVLIKCATTYYEVQSMFQGQDLSKYNLNDEFDFTELGISELKCELIKK